MHRDASRTAALRAGSVAVVTVATRSHMHRVRCLHASVARHLPQAHRCTLLVDRDDDGALGAQPVEVLPLDALPVPDLAALVARYGPVELSFAGKAFAMSAMLRRGYEYVVSLDSDIVALAPLAPVIERLRAASVLLTPHRICARPGNAAVELTVLNAGRYNSGVVAVRASGEADAFLAWWQDKVQQHCIVDPERGLVGDQRWLDLVPGLFDHVDVVREPGWNVGRWNLDERNVTAIDDTFEANGMPLLLFHFSGLLDQPPTVRSCSDESGGALPAAVVALVAHYQHELDAQGRAHYAMLPYTRARPVAARRRLRSRAIAWIRVGVHQLTTARMRRSVRMWWRAL